MISLRELQSATGEELNALHRLYGLTLDELRYILDSKEVHGKEFPGIASVPSPL
jgi:hypothetical protein